MIKLTPAAQEKVESLLLREERDDLRLRLSVQPGGCSGLVHQIFFDTREMEGDAIEEFDAFEVVVDRLSAPYLEGSTVDYVDTIAQMGFTLNNPNASSSCACGDSFA